MHVTARADYALRALVELSLHDGGLVTRDVLATEQQIPAKFLELILAELTRSGLLIAKRGVRGGYQLGRPAGEISVADVVRAVDGPLAGVRGRRPEDVEYPDSSATLRDVWVAVRASIRTVLEQTTLADVAKQKLPEEIIELLQAKGAWQRR